MTTAQLYYYEDPGTIFDYYNTLTSDHYKNLFDENEQEGGGGGALPHFEGLPIQEGYGVLRDYILPLVEKAVPIIARGIGQVIGDVRGGKDFKESVKRRTVQALKGRGRKRKAPAKKRKKAPAKKKTKRRRRKTKSYPLWE